MLKETVNWRREYKPEEITIEEIDEEARTGKMYISPFKDKAGRSIFIS